LRTFLDLEGILLDPLIATRDIHFGSSVIMAGITFFDLFVASPALQQADAGPEATAAKFRTRSAVILWISLFLSVVSGFAWLCLVAARIAGKPLADVVADGTVWIVLSQTQFGFAWELRIVIATALAACIMMRRSKDTGTFGRRETVAVLLAGTYLGALAFAGHGEEGLGTERYLHLAADFVHLIAAGIWLGGLVPLVLLLFHLRRFREETWTLIACDVAYRFSELGSVAVVTLLLSGAANVCFLLGGVQDFIDTSYGRLLLFKITMFATMVGLAGVNRQYLLPRLSAYARKVPGVRIVKWLIRSTLVEIVLGLGIIMLVGMLGIMAPATDVHARIHEHPSSQ
jgi:putative copper resistance protein D